MKILSTREGRVDASFANVLFSLVIAVIAIAGGPIWLVGPLAAISVAISALVLTATLRRKD